MFIFFYVFVYFFMYSLGWVYEVLVFLLKECVGMYGVNVSLRRILEECHLV